MQAFMHFYCERNYLRPEPGPGDLIDPLGAKDVKRMGEGYKFTRGY